MSSRSDPQLRGASSSSAQLRECKPQLENEAGDLVRPCGLIAWSLFNDTYAVYRGNQVADAARIPARETGIAWPSDVEDRFSDLPAENHNTDPATRGGAAVTGPMSEDEHLIVWMRSATLPRFRKLWGIIEQDLEVSAGAGPLGRGGGGRGGTAPAGGAGLG